jgi:tetratricopeptide (TPR) repeat protein
MLFAVFRRATGARWPSAFAAFIFAVHPLHVESVAWVAERKDVLSACLFFTALYAYVRYAEKPGPRRYLLVAGIFGLGLMAKPMLVTFPFVLLLFDFWPLRRVQFPRILWEKVPLLAMAAGDAMVTYFVQGSKGAITVVPYGIRLPNALTSYVVYISKMFWPSHLAWFYMYPDSVPLWQPALALVVLLGITALAVLTARTRPYLLTGWFWYLGTLIPVIGLVQVGAQARADRYMYLPMVGLLVMLGWGGADVISQWPQAKTAIVVAASLACAASMPVTWVQASYWQNSIALYQHAADVTTDNLWARYNLAGQYYILGSQLMNSGHGSEAIAQFQEALRVRPSYAEAHNNLAILYAKMPGRSADAISHFEAALSLDPKLIEARRNLGVLLASIPGRESEALAQLEAAQKLQPDPQVAGTIQQLREKGARP